MPQPAIVQAIDRLIKPREWYEIHGITLDGYRLIANREDQMNAGALYPVHKASVLRSRGFGMNPIRPYRDYYGRLQLETKLVSGKLEAVYAIGYTLQSKVVTIDDYSNFSWLRLALKADAMLYPNLSDQKQLLVYLSKVSKYPRFMVTRVYHHLQRELYERITGMIIDSETGS